MRLFARSFAALTFAAVSAAPLAAQAYLGTTGVGAETLRARLLAGGTGDEVYLAATPALLGTATRDAYNGTWSAGSNATRTYRFTMSWDGASTLRFGVDPLTGIGAGSNNDASVATSFGGGLFSYNNVGSFGAFRLYSRSQTTINSLTFNGADMLAGAPTSFNNVEQFWAANSGSAFEISGSMDVAMNGNGEATRFEVGVANASVVPEPGTYVLLGSGLVGLMGIARMRRRTV